jgi:hypothetical protein
VEASRTLRSLYDALRGMQHCVEASMSTEEVGRLDDTFTHDTRSRDAVTMYGMLIFAAWEPWCDSVMVV